MLHDEMVNKFDQNANEADSNLFDRLFSGEDKDKKEEKSLPKEQPSEKEEGGPKPMKL